MKKTVRELRASRWNMIEKASILAETAIGETRAMTAAEIAEADQLIAGSKRAMVQIELAEAEADYERNLPPAA